MMVPQLTRAHTLEHPLPRAWTLMVALAALLVASIALASPNLVPGPLRAAIVVRAAGYESGFADRSGGAVLAVVVGKSGKSSQDGKAMAAVFSKLLKKTRIAGRQTRVVQVVHESDSNTASKLNDVGAEVVYLASGLEGSAGAVAKKRRIVVCSHGSQVAKGCALGVELAGDKPRLVVNLKHAKAAGLRFRPALLRLARVVR
jgi:hypothetical protein